MIEARNIRYSVRSREILRDVTFTAQAGQVLAVIGQNGAGKSTLLKILSGEVTPTSGSVLLHAKPLEHITLAERAACRCVLPQHSTLNFAFSVREVIEMGITAAHSGKKEHRTSEIILQAAYAVGVSHLLTNTYTMLSGGERQRVHLARVWAQYLCCRQDISPVLLLDEPVSSLDLAFQHTVLQLAKDAARQGATVVVVLHDLHLTSRYSDHVVMMKNGVVFQHGITREVLTTANISGCYDISPSLIEHIQIPQFRQFAL